MKNQETYRTLLPLSAEDRLIATKAMETSELRALANELGLETKGRKREDLGSSILQNLEFIQPAKNNKGNTNNMKKNNGKKTKQATAKETTATGSDSVETFVATAETETPTTQPTKRGSKAKQVDSTAETETTTEVADGENLATELVNEMDADMAANDDTANDTVFEAEAVVEGNTETALAVVGNQLPAVDGEVFDVLTDFEATEREELETKISNNLDGFLKSSLEIGAALSAINAKRLYRSTHKTFEAYVTEQFEISRPHAYQLMTASTIYEAIHDDQIEQQVLPSIRASLMVSKNVQHLMPDNANQREVEGYGRAATKFVWQLIVETAPKGKDGKPNVTPAHLDSVFFTLKNFVKDGVIEIDGEQMPLTVAQASIDEQITLESSERSARMKQKLADDIEKTKTRLKQPQVKSSASGKSLNDLVSGATVADGTSETPSNVPTLTLFCSAHGESEIDAFIYAGLRLTCGCVFQKYEDGLVFGGNEKADVSGVVARRFR